MVPSPNAVERRRWLAQGLDAVLGVNDSARTIISEVHRRIDQHPFSDIRPVESDNVLSVLDLARLEELRQLSTDTGFVRELYRSFLSESADLLRQLRDLIEEETAVDRVPGVIESLQATAASVGFRRLAEVCARWPQVRGENAHQEFIDDVTKALKDAHAAVLAYVDTSLTFSCSSYE